MNRIDNPERLALSLFQKGTVSSAQFDWRLFGYECGVCFNSIPPNISFLHGVIDANYDKEERIDDNKEKQQSLVSGGSTAGAELTKKRCNQASSKSDDMQCV